MRARLACVVFVLGAPGACRPAFDDDPSRITAPRLLAARFEPPEVSPGVTVSAEVLVASPDGVSNDATVEWAMCTTPKSPAENRSVAPECLEGAAAPVAEGERVTFAVPPDACSLFGPETPPGGFRPRDPDSTGGYYQPIRLLRGDADAVAIERLLCKPSLSIDAALELARRYTPNRNPVLAAPAATIDGAPVRLDQVPQGADVRFELGWASGDAELYAAFDLASQTIVTRREALRVSWYATGGALEVPATGRDERDPGTTTDDGWHAPDAPGTVRFWAVLRDSRGGVGFTAWDVVVVER
jgi:hypothetical protein